MNGNEESIKNSIHDESQELDPVALKQQNEVLQEENKRLLNQFQNALTINEGLDLLRKENERLSKQICDNKLEINDLENRLEVSQSRNKHLEAKLVEEKKQLENMYTKEIKDLEQKLLNNQDVNQIEINKRDKQIEETENHYKSQREEFNHKIDLIFQLSSSYFQNSVTNIEELQSMFSQPPKETIKYIEKEISVKSENESNIDIQAEIREAQESVKKSMTKEHDKKINQLTKSHEKEINLLKQAFIQQEKKYQALKKKFDSVSSESEQRLKEMTSAQTQLQITKNEFENMKINEIIKLNKILDKQKQTIARQSEENSKLQSELSKLVTKGSDLEEKQENLRKKYLHLESDYSISQNDNEKLKMQNERLSKQLNETLAKFKEQTESLKLCKERIENQENSIKSLKLENEKSIAEIKFNNETFQLQKDESLKLQKQINDITEEYKKLQNEISELNSLKSKTQQEKESLHLENKALHEKLIKSKDINESSLIPLAYWTCKEFPQELSKIVNDISSNFTLKTPTKLKNVMSAIARWYTNNIERLESEVNQLKFQNEQNQNYNIDFTGKLKNIFSQVEFESNDKILEQLYNYNNLILTKLNDFMNKNAEYDRILYEFYHELDSDSPRECLETIAEMKKTIDVFNDVYQSHVKTQSEQQTEFQKLIKEMNERRKALKNELKKAKNQIENLTKEKEELTNRFNKFSLESQEAVQTSEKRANDLLLAFETQKKTYDEKILLLVNEIQKHKDENNALNNTLKTKEENIKQLELQIDELAELCESKTNEIKSLKTENINLEQRMNERIQSERSIYEEKYASICNNVVAENEECKKNIGELSSSISSMKEERDKQVEFSSMLQLKIKKLEIELHATQAELEREKMNSESQQKLLKLSAESDFKNKTEAIKHEYESMKRKFIANIAIQFSSLFNVGNQIDENNFENFIKSLKARFEFLMREDRDLRSLLDLSDTQSIVDHVESILHSN